MRYLPMLVYVVIDVVFYCNCTLNKWYLFCNFIRLPVIHLSKAVCPYGFIVRFKEAKGGLYFCLEELRQSATQDGVFLRSSDIQSH